MLTNPPLQEAVIASPELERAIDGVREIDDQLLVELGPWIVERTMRSAPPRCRT